ncbi:MAG TPA: alpha/beta hydrolase [Acidimicrobiales bacterium]|nr:alpha/beta hydrolase [Acidimicrobiales bacterium]
MNGPSGVLALHVAPGVSTRGDQANVLVVCHGFPVERDSAPRLADTLPMLADRIATDTGWPVVVGCLRGVGGSAGDFSLAGWYEDLQAVVDHAAGIGHGGGVWVVGFGTGGALGLCVAADDSRVRGVACFGSPATFADWENDGAGMIEYARRVGAIRTAGFPSDRRAWGEAFSVLRPDDAARKMPPRPLLVVHGADDEEVPIADGRRLAEFAGPGAELRILPGAGHRLRADPRAMALLAGWLERQGP